MDKIVILISAIYGDIGCSAVRSLRKAAYKIVGCDIKPYSPVSDLVDQFYIAPEANDTANYISFLKNIIILEKVNIFLPISEAEIEVINARRKDFEALGVQLMINNKNIIDTFLDKLWTAHYLEKLNVKVPKTMLLSAYEGSFKFPLIVKARKGHGRKNFQKILDYQDLDFIGGKDDGSLLIQEYISSDNEEYTTGVFSDGANVSSITFRRQLGFGSMSIEAILADEPYLHDVAIKIAQDMGLVGSINLQSRRVGGDFLIFEINPRLSSTMLFRKKFGFDDAVWWLSAFRGERHFYQNKYKSGRAVRSLTECYFDMEKIEHENR